MWPGGGRGGGGGGGGAVISNVASSHLHQRDTQWTLACLRTPLRTDVKLCYYLVHFPKGSVPQLPDHLPDVLRVHVPVDMLVLLLLPVGPQLEYLPKIEEGHV